MLTETRLKLDIENALQQLPPTWESVVEVSLFHYLTLRHIPWNIVEVTHGDRWVDLLPEDTGFRGRVSEQFAKTLNLLKEFREVFDDGFTQLIKEVLYLIYLLDSEQW